MHWRDPPARANVIARSAEMTKLELGLLQSEVADRFGVSGASVWEWERNRTEPQIQCLPAIYEQIFIEKARSTHTAP
jgi:DNA-binding XRE family transcriptional regulator